MGDVGDRAEPFRGIDEAILWRQSESGSSDSSISMLPGRIALTVIPRSASSIAAERRKPSCAALVAP